MGDSSVICKSIICDILENIVPRKSIRPTFVSLKRPASHPALCPEEKRARPDNDNDIVNQKVKHLESELQLLTENLKFVTEERDQWRLGAESARQQAEKLAAENDELEAARLEMTTAAEEQSRGCVEMLGLLLDILWASSSASSWRDVSATQMSHFLKFGSKLILQILDVDDDNKQSAQETKLLNSVVGCFVNLSSCQETMVLSGSEEIQRLLPRMIETLMKSRDQKLVQLLMMLMFNLLCTDLQYKDVDLFTREDLDNLKKVAVRWSRGERGRKSLIDVAAKLEACLEELHLGTAEQ